MDSDAERVLREHRDRGLVQVVGPLGLAANVVNIVIGAGIFVLPAAIAGQIGLGRAARLWRLRDRHGRDCLVLRRSGQPRADQRRSLTAMRRRRSARSSASSWPRWCGSRRCWRPRASRPRWSMCWPGSARYRRHRRARGRHRSALCAAGRREHRGRGAGRAPRGRDDHREADPAAGVPGRRRVSDPARRI